MDDLFTKTPNFLDGENQACAAGNLCSTMGREGCSQLETVRVLGSAQNSETAYSHFLWERYKLLEQVMRFGRSLQTTGGWFAARGGALGRRAFPPVGAQFTDQVQRARGEDRVPGTG